MKLVLIFLFVFCSSNTIWNAESKEIPLNHRHIGSFKRDGVRDKRAPVPDKDSGLLVDDTVADSPVVAAVINSPRTNQSASAPIGFLPLPPGYNKLVIPLANTSDSIFIIVSLSIREILDVDTKNELLDVDTEIDVTWIDWGIWRYLFEEQAHVLKAHGNSEEITLDAEFLKQIWKPDIYIDEMASVDRTSILSKLITLKFLVNNPVMPGAITFKARQTMRLRCDMDFHYYPADIQNCEYNIRSYSYNDNKLFLLWSFGQSVYLNTLEDSNFDFQVANVEPGEDLQALFITSHPPCCSPQNYSTLSFSIKLRRNLTYHLVQTYLPSVLLILITWLCFLLPPDMVEVRIGISMTTVLTLTAMFSAVRETSPEVSYTMAVDVWMVFCVFLVFLALVLFTVTYWTRRKLTSLREKAKKRHIGSTEDDPAAQTYAKIVSQTKKYAFWLFAIIFIVFLITYLCWLMFSANYFEWEPNPKYNAIPLEDGNEDNKLFAKQEKHFVETDKKKVVDTWLRFRKLFNEVISPRLPEPEYSEEEGEVAVEENVTAVTMMDAITTPKA